MNKTNKNIVVEIDEQIKYQNKQDLIETWTPLRDGNLFKEYLNQKMKFQTKIKNLEEDTISSWKMHRS